MLCHVGLGFNTGSEGIGKWREQTGFGDAVASSIPVLRHPITALRQRGCYQVESRVDYLYGILPLPSPPSLCYIDWRQRRDVAQWKGIRFPPLADCRMVSSNLLYGWLVVDRWMDWGIAQSHGRNWNGITNALPFATPSLSHSPRGIAPFAIHRKVRAGISCLPSKILIDDAVL